jgi:hypothetical protein
VTERFLRLESERMQLMPRVVGRRMTRLWSMVSPVLFTGSLLAAQDSVPVSVQAAAAVAIAVHLRAEHNAPLVLLDLDRWDASGQRPTGEPVSNEIVVALLGDGSVDWVCTTLRCPARDRIIILLGSVRAEDSNSVRWTVGVRHDDFRDGSVCSASVGIDWLDYFVGREADGWSVRDAVFRLHDSASLDSSLICPPSTKAPPNTGLLQTGSSTPLLSLAWRVRR